MRAVPKSSFYPIVAADMDFTDDLDSASLELAIQRSINYYENVGRDKVYRVADKVISAQQLKETLTTFRAILRKTDNDADLNRIARNVVSVSFNCRELITLSATR